MPDRVEKPSRGSDRPSVLAIQPNNPALTVMRRQRLIEAFAGLPADEQADFIEEAERIAMRGGDVTQGDRHDLRAHIQKLWDEAGLS